MSFLQRSDFPTHFESNKLTANVFRSSFDGTSRLWDSVTGECLRVFQDHKRHVYALAFSPDARFFATGGGDGWLHVYDVKVGVLYYSSRLCLTKSHSQDKNAGHGMLAPRSLASSRSTGNSQETSTAWLWLWSLTK